jgi:AraC-like DNA-binding protein
MLWSVKASLKAATDWHQHEVYEFIVCRAGSGKLEVAGRRIDLHAGRTLLVAPDVAHRFSLGSGALVDLTLLCLSAQDLATFLSPAQTAALDGLKTAAVTSADHPDQNRLWQLAAMVPDGFASGDARDLRVVWAAIGLILAMHGQAQDLPQDASWHRYREKIDAIRAWIDPRLHEQLKLDDVASQFGLSRSVLTREFRRHTGRSYVDYCNGRRVEMAALMLVAGGESITGAALASGFANLSHFHRQFKATYGVTPASFRRQILGAAA